MQKGAGSAHLAAGQWPAGETPSQLHTCTLFTWCTELCAGTTRLVSHTQASEDSKADANP